MQIWITILVTFFAGMGAGLGTGFAGMSAAAVISPMLITFLGMDPYMAVGIALSSDVLASAVSAYTYHKNGNLDVKNGLIMMGSVLTFTVVGSYAASLVPSATMGNFSVFMTFLLGIKFIVRPVMTTKESMQSVSAKKRVVQSLVCGMLIGFICGFIGAGGGMMMLLILTTVLGYELKTAVGTSVFIMTFTALLRRTGLFQDMEDGDIRRLLDCLHCPVRRYGRGEFLWHAGDAVPMAGIVLEGCVDAVQYGEDGGAVLTARQEKGGVFGDLLMAAGQASPLSLVASAEGAAVLFLPLEGILSDCGRGCACHVALRRNLLAETASKFWGLRQRVAYLTEPQLRRRILLFLRDRREAAGSDYFRVPYSRQEMAEVLGVNRSALSRELGRMQREGLLEFYRSSFRLKNV